MMTRVLWNLFLVWLAAMAAPCDAVDAVDTHLHLDQATPDGRFSTADFERAGAGLLAEMNRLGVRWAVLLPVPQPAGRSFYYDFEELLPVVRRHPERFVFLGGGGSLNRLIQEAVAAGGVDADLRERFVRRAEAIVAAGAAGFGELASLHFGGHLFHANHPYIGAPPDHELFLLLADIAARHGVVIDLHMELVPEPMALAVPVFRSPPNPAWLEANLAAFERLLAHNRDARIVWVHLGWDWLRTRTVARMRELLGRHPNLYVSLEAVFPQPAATRPLDDDGKLRPEWLALIRDFPDRIMLGSDEFFRPPGQQKRRRGDLLAPTLSIVDQLPGDLARRVGYENAERLYRSPRP